MSRITASVDFDRIKAEEIPRYLSIFAADVVQQLNNGLDFQSNVNCALVSITFGAANTDTAVSHGLGRVPAGYIVYGLSANLVVFDGAAGFTTSSLTLQASAAGTARLIVF